MQSALSELDDLGLLRSTKIPPKLAWLSSEQIGILIDVLLCGEDGMTRRATKKYDADAVRELELRDYLQWERDRFGRFAYLCLTWKGEEAAQVLLRVARRAQSKPSTVERPKQ